MTDVGRYWDAWAPHLSYFEDNHLDLANIKKLDSIISDPVLIIGAGQGLLVEQLQKSGHQADGVDRSPQMIQYAETRRGLKLIEADARNLPFESGSYSTAIIATGVVDFMNDESEIELIISEARRVTKGSGKVLVAFLGVHPAAERFARRIGLIAGGTLNQRRMLHLTSLSPREKLKIFRNDSRMSVFTAFREILFLQMFLPKREKNMSKRMAEVLKTADNPQILIDAGMESMPVRTEQDIRALFARLQLPVGRFFVFENYCRVVETPPKDCEVGGT